MLQIKFIIFFFTLSPEISQCIEILLDIPRFLINPVPYFMRIEGTSVFSRTTFSLSFSNRGASAGNLEKQVRAVRVHTVFQSEPLDLQQLLGRCRRKDSRPCFTLTRLGQKCKGESQASRAVAMDQPPQPDLQRERCLQQCASV